jgi:putative ABC transport system permease protein
LIAAEVGLALVLLVGAGLMTATMVRLIQVDRGFDSDDLLTFSYAIPRTSSRAQDAAALHLEFLDRIRADGRVVDVAAGCIAPMAGHCMVATASTAKGRTIPDAERPQIGFHQVSDDYFRTLRSPLLSGRTFGLSDTETSPPVAILNRTAARTLFGDNDPLGQAITIPSKVGQGQDYTVIGVVSDVLYNRPEEGVMPELYFSIRQMETRAVTVLVRTAGNPLDLMPAITAQLHTLETGASISDVATAREIGSEATADTRVVLWLLGFFAGSALLLAAVGIWGVVSYAVSQNTRELGVRMALGARTGEVVGLMLRRGAAAAGVGVLLGIPAALATSRLMSSLLFGVQSTDPRVYLAAAAGLSGVTLIASFIPARRATRIDPVRAMRVE